MEDAYQCGVFGQSANEDPITKYGTRAAIGVGTTAGTLAGGLLGANICFGVETRVMIHTAHHTFGSLGKLPHLQINYFLKGIKNSGKALIRIPFI